MKQNIEIKNFLVIKKASVEIKKINIIIGPQANGKSIVAKIIYFFQGISDKILDGIRSQSTKRDLDKAIIEDFESKFPRYSWEGTSFNLSYTSGNIKLGIVGEKTNRAKTTLKINYSKNVVDLYNSKKKLYSKKLSEPKEKSKDEYEIIDFDRRIFFEQIILPLRESEFGHFFSGSIFIPATRSFFANLQKNIFTFLATNLDIDPFLKEFGRLYEQAKRLYRQDFLGRQGKDVLRETRASLETIISGDYEYKDEQDWIISKSNRINLTNASSGQQESLPMLLVLSVYPFMSIKRGSFLFIEEPEAHLFPTSQGHIVSILSLLYSRTNTSFFITSHSPYILSALNNFILAGDIVSQGTFTDEEFTKLNGSGVPIKFEDVSAYTISNGNSKSIVDNELRIIGGGMLDDISEHFQDVMNQLLVLGEHC